MTADASTLDDVRRILYGGSRATFLERRKQLADEARSTGDRDRAKIIATMRKPTAAAHLVNLMAQADDHRLQSLIELGASIRRAIAEGDDRTVRTLLQDRPDAIAAAAAQARAVADAHGESASAAVRDQIAQILRAAMASDDAAAAVRAGTLTDALDEPGFDDVGIASVIPARQTPSSGTPRAPRRSTTDADQRAAARDTERAAARAEAAAAEVTRYEQALAAATKRRDALVGDREQLASQLAQVDDELDAARAEVDDVRTRLDGAAAELEAATDALPDRPRTGNDRSRRSP